MTPAVQAAKRGKVAFTLHSYEHDPKAQSYGLEASEALDLPVEQVFKTLMALVDDVPVVAMVPVASRICCRSGGCDMSADVHFRSTWRMPDRFATCAVDRAARKFMIRRGWLRGSLSVGRRVGSDDDADASLSRGAGPRSRALSWEKSLQPVICE